jgi:ATP-dependent DNA helicase RecQ
MKIPEAPSSPVAAEAPSLDGSLRELFGHDGFRDGQREVIETVLAGLDVLAVLPTGAGKSLLYQLPAFLLPGATIAISPLIALMKDQLDQLRARGMPAAILNSSIAPEEQDRTLERVQRGEIKLLFVAPERWRSGRFRAALERIRVSLFAVDEAHCVSEWGHDFRPDYLRLGEAASALARGGPRPPILAVTATATERVRKDIAASLGLAPDHRIFVRGFDRPNLSFSVVAASGEAEKAGAVEDAIAASGKTGSVIVYCATRKNCERLGKRLARSHDTVVYHAGLGALERRKAQEDWSSGRTRVVVATNAFGLGINKDDVRLVVHHDLPGSIEAYYQEAGRAGRDGLPASCVLVFAASDVHLQTFLTEGSFPERACVEEVWRALQRAPGSVDAAGLKLTLTQSSRSERAISASLKLLAAAGHASSDYEQYEALGDTPSHELGVDWVRLDRLREHEREKLARVLAYARGQTCRRATILRYFGADTGATCGTCDLCLSVEDALPQDEAKTVARKVLSLVARLRSRFGRGVVARLLAGELKPEDRERGLDAIPTVGALAPWSVDDCARAADVCLAHGLLLTATEDGKYPKLVLTALGIEVLFDRQQVAFRLPRPRAPQAEGAARKPKKKRKRERAAKTAREPALVTEGPDAGLLESLRQWRRERAKKDGVPAYCVFHDKTLEAVALARPADLAALLEVAGLGAKKVERYGEDLLETVRSRGTGAAAAPGRLPSGSSSS